MLYRWRSNAALAEELRAEFDAWLDSLPQVPDAENGMPLIMQGANAFGNYPPEELKEGNFDINDNATVKLLRQYLAAHKSALETIRKGLKYRKFQCGTDWSKGPGADIPNLLAFKTAAWAFILQGRLEELDGRPVLALDEYLNALRLGRTLSDERGVISAMIEVAVLQIGFKPLLRNLSLHWLTHEELEYVLKELVELHARGGDYSKVMETEHYCYSIWALEKMAKGEDPGFEWKTLYSIIYSRFIHDFRTEVDKCRRVLEVYRKLDPANYWSMPPETNDSDAFYKYVGISPQEPSLSTLLIPNLMESGKVVAETEVLWRGTIALAAVRLFQATKGRLPKDFSKLTALVPKESLVDPFSGKDLIYRVEGNDFYIIHAPVRPKPR
jgi:hypothetical protein